MLQTSLLLMKSLNKTESPIFLFVVCSLFPKVIVFTFVLQGYTLFFLFLLKNNEAVQTSTTIYVLSRNIKKI